MNDEKISAMGPYIRVTFSDKVQKLIKDNESTLFGWELANRSDKWRSSCKLIQFFVDEFVFVPPGAIAILIFSAECFKASLVVQMDSSI